MYVYDLDLFVTVQILDDTPAVPSLGKLCEEYGYTYKWANGQKPHQTKQEKTIPRKTEHFFVPLVVPVLSSNSGPLHRHRRTRQVHLQVQQQSEVTMRHHESGAIHQKPNTNEKRDNNRASGDR